MMGSFFLPFCSLKILGESINITGVDFTFGMSAVRESFLLEANYSFILLLIIPILIIVASKDINCYMARITGSVSVLFVLVNFMKAFKNQIGDIFIQFTPIYYIIIFLYIAAICLNIYLIVLVPYNQSEI